VTSIETPTPTADADSPAADSDTLPDVGRDRMPDRAVLAAPEERGALEVHQTVVRKVAEHAADTTPGTLPTRRTVAGVGVGQQGASAKVGAGGGEVDIRLEVALRYPEPVRETVAELRRRVLDEVRRITGYQVHSVDVTVSALLPEPTRPRVE
jgi:uncharacterized alkaline shock family protein YloU